MIIIKFGGTSLANDTNILRVRDIIISKKDDYPLIAVVSAIGGITDQLKEAGEIASEGNAEYKKVISAIERRHIQIC